MYMEVTEENLSRLQDTSTQSCLALRLGPSDYGLLRPRNRMKFSSIFLHTEDTPPGENDGQRGEDSDHYEAEEKSL